VSRGQGTKSKQIFLSAAQPQPNDRGETNAFVPSWALGRAALKGATSSLKGGEMQKSDQRPNNSKAKVTKDLLICSFSADHPVLYSKGRTLVTS
jgi:hypothetical protein